MKLYSYDHCPYCVRVRYAFGIKQIDFEHVILLNDDEETPIRLIGSKMCPILQKDDGSSMPESMDIIAYLDTQFGSPTFAPAEKSDVINDWNSDASQLIRELAYTRWVNAPLEEFATEAARQYFIKKKEQSVGPFEEALAKTEQLKPQLEHLLLQMDQIITSPEGVNGPGTMSYDDLVLFSQLRGLTIIKDLQLSQKTRAYLKDMSSRSGVALFDDIAI